MAAAFVLRPFFFVATHSPEKSCVQFGFFIFASGRDISVTGAFQEVDVLAEERQSEAGERKMKRNILMYVFGVAMLSSSMLLAQTTTPVNPQNKDQVNDRRENQQDRIAQGVQSGQLTAGETKNLEGREANLNREIRDDRSANGGKLTAAERQQVNHQQNNLSKSIYADKHNAAQQNFKGQVGARQENQQDRIAQGIKSGSLTAGEAARAENRQQGINQQIHADRAANGGKLTGAEKRQINRKQNGASRQIYREKHNGVRQ